MDFRKPIEEVIPGAQGKLLNVFAHTSTNLSTSTAARLSGVSVAQASRILPELARMGILERTEVPPSVTYRFVSDNLASQAISFLSRIREVAIDELRRLALAKVDPSISLVLFGSFARADADSESDIDVLLVHPDDNQNPEEWSDGVEEWRRSAQLLTGNEVELMAVNQSEVSRLFDSGRPVWSDIQTDGIAIIGRSLDELRSGLSEDLCVTQRTGAN